MQKKQDVFWEILARMAHNLERSGVLLSGLIRGEDHAAALQGVRAAQRDCQGRLLESLAGTVVTPLDGQDLFDLSLALNRLVSDVAGAAFNLDLAAWRPGPGLVQLAACAEESLHEAGRALAGLARRDRSRVAAATGRLHRLQDRGEQIARAARPEFDRSGAREAAWRKDLYAALNGIVFSCTEMVQTVHWVILRNA